MVIISTMATALHADDLRDVTGLLYDKPGIWEPFEMEEYPVDVCGSLLTIRGPDAEEIARAYRKCELLRDYTLQRPRDPLGGR